jgi:hypothetical protein
VPTVPGQYALHALTSRPRFLTLQLTCVGSIARSGVANLRVVVLAYTEIGGF